MLFIPLISALAFITTFFSVPIIAKKLLAAKITGVDVNKSSRPAIPTMGGLAIVAGFVLGVLVAVALATLTSSNLVSWPGIIISNPTDVLAAVTTVLIVALIGVFDDLVSIRHSVKVVLPLFASLPLIAVAAGDPSVAIPIIGQLHLPIIYPLILIPLAVTVVSNLTNMLAGFNGLEAGLGIMSCSSLGLIAFLKGSTDAAILLFSMTGALLAFIWFNKYPARVFIGDVGTLSIGACIAAAVIIGNLEAAGVVVMIPYFVDFALKVKNGFPREIDLTTLTRGKLHTSKVVGLPSLIMHVTNGITETKLVMLIVSFEIFCGAVAVLLF